MQIFRQVNNGVIVGGKTCLNNVYGSFYYKTCGINSYNWTTPRCV